MAKAAVLLASALLVACAACRTSPHARAVPVPIEASRAMQRAEALAAVLDASADRPEPAPPGHSGPPDRAHADARPEAEQRVPGRPVEPAPPAHPVDRAMLRAELEEAVRLAPDWVAPRRALDELARADLRGVEVLAQHREALARNPRDPAELYLCGRLEGRSGVLRFEQAVRVDPTCAWGWHGLSWGALTSGHRAEALAHAERALSLARDPWERSYFAQSLARLQAAAKDHAAAAATLVEALDAGDLSPRDRTAIAVQAASIGLEAGPFALRMRAYERALDLVQNEDLTEAEVADLVTRLRVSASLDDPEGHRLLLALSTRPSSVRDRLRAELLLDAAPTPLALALLERSAETGGRAVPSGPIPRAARFWARQYGAAIDRWLAALPSVVLDERGMPRDPRLARVVIAVRALDGSRAPFDGGTRAPAEVTRAPLDGTRAPLEATRAPLDGTRAPLDARSASNGRDGSRSSDATVAHGASSLADLGDALVDAGWFREARAVAAELAELDLAAALSLEARALAGLEAVQGIVQVVRRADLRELFAARSRGRSIGGSRNDASNAAWNRLFPPSSLDRDVEDLDELLAAFAPSLARAHAFLGGETDVERVRAELLASPRISYAPIGELVHPGPYWSDADAREGAGPRGGDVPGFAEELARLGRFGLFGELAGAGGPDGTILPCLLTEHRAGKHLGVEWAGTVAWCESAELKTRAGRAGAAISAAALHEGYWLDVDSVRGEEIAWNELAREFRGADAIERVKAVLEVRGLAVGASRDGAYGSRDGADETDAFARDRRSSASLLGEGQRVRLALLHERAGPNEALGRVSLDELVAVTATHEEGHLCDRTRFLPIGKHVAAVAAFALECGFSPQRIQEMLEYRAQLTCICESADPRIPLAQVLDATEGGASSVTPHAAGYGKLLDDLLATLDEQLARGDERFAEIDRGRTLVHQLHVLSKDDVRALARLLAKKKRM